MKKRICSIVLLLFVLTSNNSIVYAEVQPGVCKDSSSEELLETKVMNIDSLIEEVLDADTKDSLQEIKKIMKSEQKDLKKLSIRSSIKRHIKI